MRNVSTAVYRAKNGLSQNVAIGAASAQITNAFGTQTRIVVVECKGAAAHVNFGTNPTATTADFHMPADTPIAFIVDPGQKVAVIQDAGAGTGTLYASEVTF